MRRNTFLTSLIATLLCSLPAAAAGSAFDVIYPFLESENLTMILDPYLQESFLDFLINNSVQPVFDSDGLPLFYYSQNQTFGCTGICSNVSFNNFTLGSKSMNITDLPGYDVFNESIVFGNPEVADFMDTMNAIRESLQDNPEALSDFESQLLEQQEGFFREQYFDNAYDDVWDYALEQMRQTDPEMYNQVLQDLSNEDLQSAIDGLEEYFGENFDIDESFDLSNLFSALENQQIGQSQLEELMRNMLERMADEENLDIDLSGLDNLDQLSDLLDSPEFDQIMDRVSDTIAENPEMFDRLSDLAQEMLDRPETKEVFKNALKEVMENADWETMDKLMEMFNNMDNKDQLMQTMMEAATEHMRDMINSGQLDEIKDMVNSPEMQDMMMRAAQSFSESIFENLSDWVSGIPLEFAYIVAAAAIILTLIILMKTKI